MENDSSDKGISLKEALLEKYSEDRFNADLNYIHLSPRSQALSRRKVLDFSQRTILALDDCKISCAGAAGEIAELCPKVEELDLGDNNFADWREVFVIISQLHHLNCLNLSGNPLTAEGDVQTLVTDFHHEDLHVLAPVKRLVLNNTGVPLKTVYSLLVCLPGVEELYLSLNEYSSVPSTESTFPHIKHLYLNQHNLSDWTEVMKLGKIFPRLEELIMTEAPLENILPTDAPQLFAKLRTLKLNKTAISSWEDIDALNAFPMIKDVRLLGIPLLEPYCELQKRQLLIARLPNMDKINGTKVEDVEKEDAERFFVRHHMVDVQPPKRYQELVNIHGLLDKLVEIDMDPKTMATVSIHYEECAPFTMNLNLKQTTKIFKKELSNELGFPSAKMQLFYNEVGGPYGLEEMKLFERALYCYNIADGDEIHVFRKGV